jgi:hypothetical protein
MPTTAKDVLDLFTQVVPYLDQQQLSSIKNVLQKTKPPPSTLPQIHAIQARRHAAKRISLQKFIPVAKAIVYLVDTGHTVCLRWSEYKELTMWAVTDDSHPNQPLALRRTFHFHTMELAGQQVISAVSIKPPRTVQKLLDRFFMIVLYVLQRIAGLDPNVVVDSFGPVVSQFGYPLLSTEEQPGFLTVAEQRIGQYQQYMENRLHLDTSVAKPSWIKRLTA